MLAEAAVNEWQLSAAAARLCRDAEWEVTEREPLFLCDAAHLIISGLKHYQLTAASVLNDHKFDIKIARRITRPYIVQSRQRPEGRKLAYTAGYERSHLRAIELMKANYGNTVTEIHLIAGALLSDGLIIEAFFDHFHASRDDMLDQLQVNWRDIEIPRRQPYVTR